MGGHHESELLLARSSTSADCQPFVQKLVSKDILTDRDLDIIRLKPFRMTAKRMEITRDRNSTLKWCYGSLSTIEKMARAMGHLVRASVSSDDERLYSARILPGNVPYLLDRDRGWPE
jgi:hypothetical protein